MRKLLKLFGLSLIASLFSCLLGVLAAQSIHTSNSPTTYNLPSDVSKLKAVSEINHKFIFPLAVDAPVTSPFGDRVHPLTGEYRFHAGVDLGAEEGTPVLAALAGEVVFSGEQGGYGLAVHRAWWKPQNSVRALIKNCCSARAICKPRKNNWICRQYW